MTELYNPKYEEVYWKPALNHFKQIGIIDTMMKVLKIKDNLIEYLGFQFAYNLSYVLLNLLEEYDPKEVGLNNLTYKDWD